MNVRRLLVRIMRTAALVAVGAALFLLISQSRMIYFPRPYEPSETSAFAATGGRTLEFTTPHGRQTAYFRPSRSGSDRLWLFCPGNAMLGLDAAVDSRRWDEEAGWLFIDYPSYGGNSGSPSPLTVTQNVTGAVDALAAHLGLPASALVPRLGAVGQSLGAAAALAAAEAFSLQRVILIAPFTTLTEMARLSVGWPLCLVNTHRYNNRRALAAVTARGAKVWIIHGVDDEIVPVTMARELRAIAPDSVVLVEVRGGSHNDLWEVAPDVLTKVFQEAGGR